MDRTTPDVFERFREAITGLPEVLECHMVAGGFDYLLKIRSKDMTTYRRILGEDLTALPGSSLQVTKRCSSSPSLCQSGGATPF